MIPKIIHYCWFGGNPLPELAQKCIASWKKFCPDYKIKEWNESNFDINRCVYTREAYEAKKWPFVSDYARFKILYDNGGLYFDTDVELIKPIDDIIEQGGFMGLENDGETTVAPGLGLGASPSLSLYQEILDFYNKQHFFNNDGTMNQTTIVAYTTNILKRHGLKHTHSAIQCVAGVYIYPQDYFCPMDCVTGKITITDNTRSIHHYMASAYTPTELRHHKLGQKARNIFGMKIGNFIERIYTFPYRVKQKLKQKGFIGTIKFAIAKISRKV